MKKVLGLLILLLTFHLAQAGSNPRENSYAGKTFKASLKVLSDAEYPDNNNIGFRSSAYGTFNHNGVIIKKNEMNGWDVYVTPANAASDTVIIRNVNLLELMPTIPNYVKGNKGLAQIALLNQEWNRIQVKYPKENCMFKGYGSERDVISRADISNNCLAKGLWEIILFSKDGTSEMPYFQSWFTFPTELYNELFKQRNGVDISTFDNMLINYDHNVVGTPVNLDVLRKAGTSQNVTFVSKNDELYPLVGERQTKQKNIIYPVEAKNITEFLTNQTSFATFDPPGFYNRDNPRKTELGLLAKCNSTTIAKSASKNAAWTTGMEITMSFTTADGSIATTLVLGGIQKSRIPALSMNTTNKAFQMPMGIGNHSFYNSYSDMDKFSSKEEAYYGLLLDKDNKWVDSHDVGIDGPLLFFDDQDPTKLHILILSFERHAFVGHYVVDLSSASL